jgi:hypothetical protein
MLSKRQQPVYFLHEIKVYVMLEVTIIIVFFLLFMISAFFNNLPTTKTKELTKTEKTESEDRIAPFTLFTDLTDEDIKRAIVDSPDLPGKDKSDIVIALIDASMDLLEKVRALANQFLENEYLEQFEVEPLFDIIEAAVRTENYISETERTQTMILSDPGSMTHDFDALRVKLHLHLLKTIDFYKNAKKSINDLLLFRDGLSEDDIVIFQAGEFLDIIELYLQSIETAGYAKSDSFNNSLRPLIFDFAVRITCDGSTISPYNTRMLNKVFSLDLPSEQYLDHYDALRAKESNNASDAPERRLANFLHELARLNCFALIDFNHVVELFFFHFSSSEPKSDSSESVVFRLTDLCSQLCRSHKVPA